MSTGVTWSICAALVTKICSTDVELQLRMLTKGGGVFCKILKKQILSNKKREYKFASTNELKEYGDWRWLCYISGGRNVRTNCMIISRVCPELSKSSPQGRTPTRFSDLPGGKVAQLGSKFTPFLPGRTENLAGLCPSETGFPIPIPISFICPRWGNLQCNNEKEKK